MSCGSSANVVTPRKTSSAGTPMGTTSTPPASAADLVLGERQEDLDPRARLLQPPRHDEAVAAVAALAAHDDDTGAKTLNPPLVEERPDPLRGPTPGVLHEGRARDAELGDRASIETPHLLRREDAVHGGYRPGS